MPKVALICAVALAPLSATVEAQGAQVVPGNFHTFQGQKGGTASKSARTSGATTVPKVTITLENISRVNAIRAIGKAIGYNVVFSESVIRLTGNVTHSFKDLPADQAIAVILRGTGVKSEIVTKNRSILLTINNDKSDSTVRDSVYSIQGLVIDSVTRLPLANVAVRMPGTSVGVVTNIAGVFLLRNVPAGGPYTVVVQRLGYKNKTTEISVPQDTQEPLIFSISSSATVLNEVVTTGAGEQERRELGNSVPTIKADSIADYTSIRSVSDLLKTRAPGLDVVSSSGTAGSASRIRIRGIASLLGNLDPIVIIDGLRINTAFSSDGSANNSLVKAAPATSRLDDIDPASIETIDILKGPAASALYGSDAAAGVIVIKTKRGVPGPTRWDISGSWTSASMEIGKFPEPWKAWGTPMSPGAGCNAASIAAEICLLDSLTSFNPLNDKSTSPLSSGHGSRYSFGVSGGTPAIQYYVGGTYDDQVGPIKLASRDMYVADSLRKGNTLPGWIVRPNTLKSASLTNKLTAQVNRYADVGLSFSMSRRAHSDAEQGSTGLVFSGIMGQGYRDSLNHGWGNASMLKLFSKRITDDVDHFIGSVSSNIRPTQTLHARMLVGLDASRRTDEILQRRDEIPGQLITGARGKAEITSDVMSADLGMTHDLAMSLQQSFRTTLGFQFVHTRNTSMTAQGTGLPLGGSVIDGASILSATELAREQATAGWYLNETVQLRSPLYVTFAFRADAGSAFGKDAKASLYPKTNASWVISEESFFPRIPQLDNLRLRFAFGTAGIQPEMTARFRTFGVNNGFVSDDVYSYVYLQTIGNSKLVPERSVEMEGGLDIGFFNERIGLDITYYRKNTRDALINRTLPQSVGIASRQENVGDLRNTGIEFMATVRPLDNAMMSWTAQIGYTQNRNKLTKVGSSVIPQNGQYLYRLGYPIDGLWEKPILGYEDANGDGVVEGHELRIADSLSFIGSSSPKRILSLHNNVLLLSGRVSVGSSFEYRGPMVQHNEMVWQMCMSRLCEGTVNPKASIAAQVLSAAISTPNPALNPYVVSIINSYPFYEYTSTFRFNELSVTMFLPKRVLSYARARNGSVSILGRNLGLWSSYRGSDPEVNTKNAGIAVADAGGVPQSRDWILRFNFGF